jgi:hypothetical protein
MDLVQWARAAGGHRGTRRLQAPCGSNLLPWAKSTTWIYDLRTNAPSFGKRTLLTRDYFRELERAYGAVRYGQSPRKDQGKQGRWRCFSRELIAKRDEKLDILWLRDKSEGSGAGELVDAP